MATVTIQPKANRWYTVITYKDENGKWRNKMQATGLVLSGNKAKALRIASERLANFVEPTQRDQKNPYLADYLEEWLKHTENRVERTTYSGYESSVHCVLAPYFREKGIRLKDFSLRDAQQFYDSLTASNRGKGGSSLKPTTIRRYHAALHKALEHAIKLELIDHNPTDKVELPRNEQIIHNTFTEEELRQLNRLLENETIGPLIKFDSIYGVRRSEMCGLRWKSIDFDNNVLTIEHTVVMAKGKSGKREMIFKDRTKNKSSHRTLPLTPEIREMLLNMKKEQEYYKELFGNGYCQDFLDYVFVDKLGKLISPDYLTARYTKLRNRYGLPKVTLHEIRHTVATLLLKKKVPMKYVQVTLGHSDISTTANIYMHAATDEATSETTGIMSDILNGNKEKAGLTAM